MPVPPNPWSWWRALAKVVLSVLCAGITYFVWLAVVLLSKDSAGSVLRALFWVAAPVATAMGFAAGIVMHERMIRDTNTSFWRTLLWPLVGCAIGALAVYWYGPMLIVFGMFAVGSVSVVLREVALRIKDQTMRDAA